MTKRQFSSVKKKNISKVQEYQLFGDDTALNGIMLLCTGEYLNTTITSGEGHRGEWGARATCHQNLEDKLMFIRAFVLQVEEYVSRLFSVIVKLDC